MSEAPVTTEELLRTLTPWLPAQRWFHEHQDTGRLVVVESFELVDPAGEARLPVLLLGTGPEPRPPWLQVPLALRPVGSPTPATPLGTLGTWHVLDGPADPAFVRAWLAAAEAGEHAPPVPAGVARADELDPGAARIVSGEQSNTSVIVPAAVPGRTGGILKVFRGVWPGRNPDVDVPAALARAGFAHVPAPIAWLERRWAIDTTSEAVRETLAALDAPALHGEPADQAGPTAPSAPTRGEVFTQLGVLSAFVPGAEDGFELACAMAERGESFAVLARELGVVLAELHEALAQALPTGGRSVRDDELTGHLHERLEWAIDEVPTLAAWHEPVSALVDRLTGLADLPALQRIHGDLHLGQLLHAGAEWFVLDFEGEPLVPLPARAQPDLALRDVAGVLRSFDYAAARGGADESWTTTAREAFLEAYRAASPGAASPTAALVLRAFEVDKALYEVVYETQNRPAWAAIPTRALHRLVGSPSAAGGGRVGA